MKRLLVITMVLSLLFSLAACSGKTSNQYVTSADDEPQTNHGGQSQPENPTASLSPEFAANPGYHYSGTPAVPDYNVEPELGNIENKPQFTTGYLGKDWEGNPQYGYWLAVELSDETIAKISQNGFAISDSKGWREYFGVYEDNRYKFTPSFITTDSALHTFHLVYEYALKNLEQERLHGILSTLSKEMAAACSAQYDALKGTEFENAALRNAAFFAVGASLLDDSYTAPNYVRELVAQETSLIKAHDGIAASPIINYGAIYTNATDAYFADYTQYIPRSHYTATPELTAYFKAMIWYGQMTFRSNYEDEVKSALLQVSAMQNAELAGLWAAIFEPTNFFVGECDDITWLQLRDAMKDIYSDSLGDLKAITEPAAFRKAFETIKQLPPPAVNSIPIFNADLQPDKDAAITGYRFMGQRFTIDGAIMQRLIDRETADRMLPKALDIPAAFGSAEAYAILESEGEIASFPQLAENMGKVRQYVAGVDEKVWHSNLYWSWLDMLRPLAGEQAGAGMPFFMRNQAWTRKELNTFVSSWTELKHDTLLYSKPPMAEMGGGGGEPPEPPDDRGYVEPNPEVFGRLANLTRMISGGLEQRGLFTEQAGEAFGVLQYLADGLCRISEKELANEPLTDEEYEFIRVYGGELEHIFDSVKRDDVIAIMGDYYRDQYLMQHPGALVADVASDPNGSALEEATGFAKEIYVAFPRDGRVVLGRGVVFSHYEFVVPLSGRMTDDAWHERLNSGERLPVDDWKKMFLTDTDAEPRISYQR